VTVRFPDQYPSLREVDGLSDTAFRLAVTSVFWAATNSTDGVVPAEDLGLVCARVRAPERFAAECVRRGAWHDARHDCGSEHCPAPVDVDGWVIHDYWKEQPTAADAEACETAKSDGGRLGNHKRWHVRKGIRKDGCEFCHPPDPPSHDRSGSDRICESVANPRSSSDFDFDFGSQVVNQSSKSDARARDDAEAIIAAVIEAAEAKTGSPVTAEQARSAIAVIRQRAASAGVAIASPVRYFTEAIGKEPDAWALLLADALNDAERVMPALDGTHRYDPDPETRSCRACHAPEVDSRHRRRTA
jgi:hypothetical protein